MSDNNRGFLPTSKKEVEQLGWDYIDVIIFSGDAYVDHPSFGSAVIGRVLEQAGYRVAIVPQPNWQDDLRDFRKLGKPRLFFGVNSGAMDSMVNHYTAAKRLRSNDAYTPDGRAGQRPDYAVTVYSRILKKLYPDTPVVIGGIEASLRRLTHYDYWQDRLLPSVLVDSGADILVYGMGELPILDIASILDNGGGVEDLKHIPQIAYLSENKRTDSVVLYPYEDMVKERRIFAENFRVVERESNSYSAAHLDEPYKDIFVHINPPYDTLPDGGIDRFYDLPYKREPHYRYRGKHIPAYEMIKFSINIHRGCFGSCAFCTISAHQGKFIQSRSSASILKEVHNVTEMEGFRGYISDLGGPSANMYGMKGKNIELCKKCKKDSCLYPRICANLNHSHKAMLNLYKDVCSVKGVKKSFISSGIRYDLFLDREGFLNNEGQEYFKEVVLNHTSGRLKVAPEHTEEHILRLMGKPSFSLFGRLKQEFDKLNKIFNKRYQIVPYFISSHPGCRMDDMAKLADNPMLRGIKLEQVQDFTPTPMTRSSACFYTGYDIMTMKPIFVEKNVEKKKRQKSFFLL
jgi:uncharacterized radical SAM protein YgiQ